MSKYIGDFPEDAVVSFEFNVFDANDEPAAFSGAGSLTESVEVYKSTSTTPHTAKYTPTVLDSNAGVYRLQIDMSAHAFFETGASYCAILTGADIEAGSGKSVTNTIIRTWSCEARSALIPDNHLDADKFDSGVLATDADIADAVLNELVAEHATSGSVGAVLTAIDGNVDDILADTGTQGVLLAANAIGDAVIQDNAITAAKIATDAITADKIATGAITSAKFAAGAIDAAAVATGAIDADALASDALAGISSEVVKKLGIPMTLTGASTTTSLVADDAPTGLTTTQIDDALVLHLASGSYSRVTAVSGTAPNLTLTVSPALPATPANDSQIVVFGKYLASL